MPIIRVEMFEGRTVEQKRRLAAALTDAIVEEAGADRASVRVVFSDYAKTDWAIGGTLAADREAASVAADAEAKHAAEQEAEAAAAAAQAEVVGPEERSSAT